MSITKVSVVIPTYNPGPLIDVALASVDAQTWPGEVEIVVVDDGSSDGTAQRLLHERPDLLLLQQPNGGTAAARNAGVAASTGDAVAFLDQDDSWEPAKLELQVLMLDSSDAALVHTGARFVNTHAEVTSVEPGVAGLDHHRLLAWCLLVQSTALVRRDVLDAVGSFDESLSAADDWDMWIRIAQVGSLAVVPQVLTSVLVHSNNQSNDAERMFRSADALIGKHRRINRDCPECLRALRAADRRNRQEYYRRMRGASRELWTTGRPVAAARSSLLAVRRNPWALWETPLHHLRARRPDR